MVLLLLPIFLVLSQPDLGTSVLIAASGIAVLWLAGTKIKYFVYSSLIFIISAPFIISFLKPGIITIFSKSGEDKFYVEDGIVEFKNNNLSVLTSSIFNVKEIEKMLIFIYMILLIAY